MLPTTPDALDYSEGMVLEQIRAQMMRSTAGQRQTWVVLAFSSGKSFSGVPLRVAFALSADSLFMYLTKPKPLLSPVEESFEMDTE